MYDSNTEHHYHFFDETSGKLIDIDPDRVEVKARFTKGFKMHEMEIVFKGKVK
ncbi:MAG: hypothetical protein R3A45_12800 [Bdellovibrionota bacterium]